ncbi:hypothetical protein Leryth_024964 [Lithospermum erythrorhizon]|nr:hypothetical protein Leryth_024964 [Lithospermum erythrorhizon]
MGKPTLDQCEGSINHFSHQHPLQLYNHSTLQISTHLTCSGCHDEASGSMYHCSICNYYLHKKCSEMPQKITHPFDQEHVLCLLEKPKYPEGIFNCDACGQKGGGFSYHCETCGTDLHILCASLPIHFNHHCHVHQLTLSFSPAYPKKSFHCGICQCLGSNVWFYRCSSCEFDVHLSCVSALRKPQVQHPTSSMTNYINNFQNPMPQQIG